MALSTWLFSFYIHRFYKDLIGFLYFKPLVIFVD